MLSGRLESPDFAVPPVQLISPKDPGWEQGEVAVTDLVMVTLAKWDGVVNDVTGNCYRFNSLGVTRQGPSSATQQ